MARPRAKQSRSKKTARRRVLPVTFVPGQDISMLLAPTPGRRHPLKGFDADYVDFVDYIIRCTHRIWEEKQLDLIPTHYTRGCVIHTLAGEVRGPDAVVANTAKTLSGFPDRTLFGNHVIWTGDDAHGFYSSHRITSHLTNLGASDYGPATGRRATIVTIADCAVKANRIYEEWLVRDNLGLVLQLGLNPHAIARRQAQSSTPALRQWRAAETRRIKALRVSRSSSLPDVLTHPENFARIAMNRIWNDRSIGLVRTVYAPATILRGTSGRDLLGHAEVIGFVVSLLGALPDAKLSVDHVCAVSGGAGESVDIALRWTLAGKHSGAGIYGPATGRDLLILGCTHWHVERGVITQDWTVFDELAVLAQAYGG